MTWRNNAACLGMDTELFFPESGQPATAAKQVCGGCFVRTECLTDSLTEGDQHGIRGGLNRKERYAIRRAA